MEDSRFSTSPGSFSCFLWSKLMMMIQIRETLLYDGNASFLRDGISRHPVFVEVHSDYGLSVACRPLEWKSSSEATFAVPSSLLQPRLRVYSGETRTIFLSVQIQSILIYIYLFTFDMDTRNYRYSMKSLLRKRN